MSVTGFRSHFLRLELSRIALAIGLIAGMTGPALAQGGSDASSSSTADSTGRPSNEDIIITGSRLGRSTFNTTNPVTVLDQKDIQNLNLNNVAEVVAQLPSNSNFFAANNVGLGNFNVGAQLVNLRGLNPFFGTRTLTLIDTRRVVPTTTGGGVDISLIPSMLVGRTETVTGGASAIYGSDAVAGVVNIILDTKLEGLKAQADLSQTTYGDGTEYHASAAWGTGFSGGQGHIVLGAEFQKTESIGICSKERAWCSSSYGLFTNSLYAGAKDAEGNVIAPPNGLPHYIIGQNAQAANSSNTGMIVPCLAYVGVCIGGTRMQFDASGKALMPYHAGAYSDAAGFFGFQQGTEPNGVGAYDTTTMRPSVKRYSMLGHLTYEFSPGLNAFIEGSYARSEAVNPVANGAIGPYALEVAPNVYAGSHIAQDNAYLTPEIAAAIGPAGAQFGRNMINVQTARNETNNDTWRVVGGLGGTVAGSWSWDAYYEHGVNKNDQHLYHNVVSSFLNYAMDAVQTPSGIVCGVTIPGRINPATGTPYTSDDVAKAASGGTCAPLNLFGIGNASQASIDYAFRTLVEFSTYTQDAAALNLHGNLFGGWGAGPIKLATGVEWRHEHGNVTHDLAHQPWYEDYTLGYGLDYAGRIEVLEGYGELNVPIFANSPVGKYFELDGAVRATRNKSTEEVGTQAGQSRTNDFTTWKVSGIWDLTSWLRFRGTRSRDVRAAQFRELFQSYAVTAGGPFGSVNNPWNGGITDPVLSTTGGDVNLKPETADTLTLGAVLSLPRFHFSADWYQIDLHDAIVGPPFGIGAQNIVAQCNQELENGVTDGPFCSRMTGEGTTDIIAVDNVAANLQGFTTRGIDFEGAYTLPLTSLRSDWGGTLSFRVLASYLYDQLFSTGLGTATINYAGQSGPTAAFGSFNTAPKWQGNAFLTYTGGPVTGTVQVRYVGPGRFTTVTANGGVAVAPGDPDYSTTNPDSISENHVDQAFYINLSGSVDLIRNIQLFGSVNNLLDKDPSLAPGGNGYPTNPVYFDTYGRTWRVGLRAKF